MKPPIDVSRGQLINFAANGVAVSGIIVGSKQVAGPWAAIVVETDEQMPQNAQLSIPELPETGGCGLAQPVVENGRVLVELNIGYSYIDIATIGR